MFDAQRRGRAWCCCPKPRRRGWLRSNRRMPSCDAEPVSLSGAPGGHCRAEAYCFGETPERRLWAYKTRRSPGRFCPAIFAFYMPKASAQESHQSKRPRLDNALLALRKDSRVLRHRRAFADCFGANPVASALGSSTRRDPGRCASNISRVVVAATQNRNFLLCSKAELSTLP